ncbi:alpha/beta fold hydrolase [Actinosynnema sp. CS-041913]|uniref:alpha/beta fold hydrolase n=1 Tax=Actinosynnema sp. CS-041913 TaxID=3239917 RepID=UPI003D9133B4
MAELKRFIVVHAKAQGLRPAAYQPVLDGIDSDVDGEPRSWATAWRASGEALERAGRALDASRRYVMARFPYVDGPARRDAQERYLRLFVRWAAAQRDVRPLEVRVGDAVVRCWTTGLSAAAPRPLVLIMGGIVSVKEQWAPTLRLADRLGLAAVVTEMPGVGENALRYGPDSHRMISAVLDAVSDRADASRTTALALSFSGHLALRCAVEDRRIAGIVTAGAPVSAFFTDRRWREGVPRLTTDTLAHLTGEPADALDDLLPALALTTDQLDALDVPVRCLVSGRDEVIPPDDARLLRDHVRDLRVQQNDDYHGSPRHVLDSRLWVVESLLRLTGGRGLRPALVRGLRTLARTWQPLTSDR